MEIIDTESRLVGGTIVGSVAGSGTTLVKGVRGNALYMDGTANGVVNMGTFRDNCFYNPNLCPQGFTMSFWLYMYSLPLSANARCYISNGGQTKYSYGVAVYLKGDKLVFRVKNHITW